MDNLQTWILREIDHRGWVQAELARRSDVSPSHISRVLSGEAKLGIDLVIGLSQALETSTDEVLSHAGMLPQTTNRRRPIFRLSNNLDERLAVAFGRLKVTDQELVVFIAERLAGLVEGRIIGEEGE